MWQKGYKNGTNEVSANQPILTWLGWGWVEQYLTAAGKLSIKQTNKQTN